ncbi:GLRB [Symbiodinium sp. CCMP2592]|nr:GLRB [Symbiodinium sp. CCMP2592]
MSEKAERPESSTGIKGIPPDGYEDGVLTTYTQFCHEEYRREVDCSGAIKVYIDIAAHDLKAVDDHHEEFHMVFVLKLSWLDPDLKNYKSRVAVRDIDGESKIHLRKLDVVITKMYANGDIEYIDMSDDHHIVKNLRKKEYVTIQEPDWSKYFFPSYSILNLQHGTDNQVVFRKLLWSDENGGFATYSIKYDATLKESLDLRRFPLDRQLCRIRLTAERTIDEFQFVVVKGNKKGIGQICAMWHLDDSSRSTVYVRHCDRYLPFASQRSCVNAVFHLERKGEYYFRGKLLMVFLVNILSLCVFAISLEDVSGRLRHLSRCFLAVLAYRYVIDGTLPRKEYLTGADAYIVFACSFQALLVIETVVFHKFLINFLENPILVDRYIGLSLLLAWCGVNSLLRWLWQHDTGRNNWEIWEAIYKKGREPYAPINRCSDCGEMWLSKQCEHSSKRKQCINWPDCFGENESIATIYKTPFHPIPAIVEPQAFPRPPPSLKELPETRERA